MLIKKLILSGLALFLTLVGIELWLRISTVRIEPTACRRFDPLLHHSLVPQTRCRFKTPEWDNFYVINSQGLRDSDHTYAKPPGVFRALMLGDSFTEGYGVSIENTFGKVLETYVKQALNSQFELINAGVASWSPTPEYIYLRQFGLKYQPDLVTLNLTISDFSDEYFYERAMTPVGKDILVNGTRKLDTNPNLGLFTKPPDPTAEASTDNPSGLKQSLWGKFKSLLRDNLKIYRFLSLKVRFILGLYNPITSLYPADIGKIEADQLAASRETEPVKYQEALAKIETNIYRVKQLLDTHGIKFVLILVPHPHMVNGQEWTAGRKSFGLEPGKTYSDRGFKDLSNWASKIDIEVVNLLPYLQVAAQKHRLYFNADGHLNIQGNQAVAQALLGALSARFLGQN